MLGVHCLSCEHENPVGAKFCADCGSPLNLKLCKQCEAINESTAQRCYKCGVEFSAQPAADQSGVAEAASGPKVRMLEVASLAFAPLRAYQAEKRFAAGRIGTSRKLLSALLLAVIAGSAYHFYRSRDARPSAITGMAAPTPDPGPTGVAAAGAPAASSAEAASPALPVNHSRPLVTHTNRGVAAPAEPDASTPASATAPPVAALYQPVTHTKPAVAAPAASGPEPRTQLRQDQPSSSNCTPAVAALGLCTPSAKAKSGEKEEGN
jgi:ribosomal protein L40E